MRVAQIVVAYIVAIFGFAGAYAYYLPHDFYHAYVKYEPEIRDLLDRVQQELARSIDNQLKTKPDLDHGIQFQLAYGLGIQAEQDGVLIGSIRIGATLQQDDSPQLFTARLPIQISPFGLRTIEKENAPRTLIDNAEQLKERVQTVYIARDPEKPALDETMLQHNSSDQASVTDALGRALERVQLSDGQKQDLFAILNVERGFPAFAEGTFWRMLYFSAVTITTVGYGDIVPLTHRGRAIAAFEATLGIILLGLLVARLTET